MEKKFWKVSLNSQQYHCGGAVFRTFLTKNYFIADFFQKNLRNFLEQLTERLHLNCSQPVRDSHRFHFRYSLYEVRHLAYVGHLTCMRYLSSWVCMSKMSHLCEILFISVSLHAYIYLVMLFSLAYSFFCFYFNFAVLITIQPSLLVAFYSLLIAFYSLLVTFYSLLVTFYSLLITFYSLLVTFYSLLVTFLIAILTCYSLLLTRYTLRFICKLLHYIHKVYIKLYVSS